MRLPRLVATDLDGTLLRSDGSVSARTRSVLEAVQQRGVTVVLVTARPMRWMEPLWPLVGDRGLAVVSNGAVLYDVEARAVRAWHGIEPAEGLAIAATIRERLPRVALALETLEGLRRDEAFVDPDRAPEGTQIGPIEEIWTVPAVKVLVRDPSTDPADLLAAVEAAVGAGGETTWTTPGLVEVGPPGVTKGTGLVDLCGLLGVDAADVVAFGDMPNDLPMLAWAGTSYAVANAHPSVRDAADHVVGDHDADGVAEALAGLLGLPGPDGTGA